MRRQQQGQGKNKNTAPLPCFSFKTAHGSEIWVGRNNRQNDELSLKRARKEDWWFHAQQAPGAHVILHLPADSPLQDSDLEEEKQVAAGLAAWYSRPGRLARQAGQQSAAAILVDCCRVRQLRKPKGAHPGMLVYEGQQSFRVAPLDPSALGDEEMQN